MPEGTDSAALMLLQSVYCGNNDFKSLLQQLAMGERKGRIKATFLYNQPQTKTDNDREMDEVADFLCDSGYATIYKTYESITVEITERGLEYLAKDYTEVNRV